MDKMPEIVDPVHLEIACTDALYNASAGISNAPVHVGGTDDIFVVALPREMMSWPRERIEYYLRTNFNHQVSKR